MAYCLLPMAFLGLSLEQGYITIKHLPLMTQSRLCFPFFYCVFLSLSLPVAYWIRKLEW